MLLKSIAIHRLECLKQRYYQKQVILALYLGDILENWFQFFIVILEIKDLLSIETSLKSYDPEINSNT